MQVCARPQVQFAKTAAFSASVPPVRARVLKCRCHAQQPEEVSRRHLMQQAAAVVVAAAVVARLQPASAAVDSKVLCEAECVQGLGSIERVTLPSGLAYQDIVVGTGPSPPTGFQVVCDYVAMTPNGKVFESSLDRGKPFDIRVGAGQVVPGLDEGIKSMKVGGLRRIYVPGSLAFPKGLKAAAGRPSVPPNTPVVFDVKLLYIPGLDLEDE